MQRLAALVIEARGAMTQAEFAAAVGVHVTVIQRIERDRPGERPSADTVQRLVDYLGTGRAKEVWAAAAVSGVYRHSDRRGSLRARREDPIDRLRRLIDQLPEKKRADLVSALERYAEEQVKAASKIRRA